MRKELHCITNKSDIPIDSIAIIGDTCTGKTALLNNIGGPWIPLEIEKLYETLALSILQSKDGTSIASTFTNHNIPDSLKNETVSREIYSRSKLINTILERMEPGNIQFGNQCEENDSDIIEGCLNSSYFARFVQLLANNKYVGKAVMKRINDYSDNKPVIVTGFNLDNIDTTKYRIVYLKTDKSELDNRSSRRREDSSNIAESTGEYQYNSEKKGDLETTINRIYNPIVIDTTSKSPAIVRDEVEMRVCNQIRHKNTLRKRVDNSNLVSYFHWNTNPLLGQIRKHGQDLITNTVRKFVCSGINEFDLAVQVMIHASAYDPSIIWKGLDGSMISLFSTNFDEFLNYFNKSVNEEKIILNDEKIGEIAFDLADRIKQGYHSLIMERPGIIPNLTDVSYTPFPEGMCLNVLSREELNDKLNGCCCRLKIADFDRSLIIKEVCAETSKTYADSLHYIHEARSDEFAAYGIFIDGDNYPFAWVSYSPVDRDYKKDMLFVQGVEPHRVLEMTRAWSSIWSPKNSMSILFDYAHKSLKQKYEQMHDEGKMDKSLQGIVTAINPNLNFHASSFRNIGFKVIGLKPANFTFIKEDNKYYYMSRRALCKELGVEKTSDLHENPLYSEQVMPLLPTNEMLLLFNKANSERLDNQGIYVIKKEITKMVNGKGKILIATTNIDKYSIVESLMISIGINKERILNLNDLGLTIGVIESGSIADRARLKAQYFANNLSKVNRRDIRYVLSIDDGILLPGNDKPNPNIKSIVPEIVNGSILKKGDTVKIVRSFHLIDLELNISRSCIIAIPFDFIGAEKIRKTKSMYPLSKVLSQVGDNKPIGQITAEKSNKYYLKYAREPLEKLLLLN